MEICPVTSFYFVGAKIQLIFKLAKNIFAKRGKKVTEKQRKYILFSTLNTIKKKR